MMRKGIDPPHIVALTIVVCAAIAPAFMLWGRTIGEWAVGIAVYTLITAVVLSLLVLDFVIVRYDVMALLIQALSGSEIVGSVSRLLFVLGQIWVIILSIRIPPSFWEKRLAVLPFQADPDNSALALCIGLFSGAFLLVIVALWMPEDLPGVPEFWNAQVCMDSIFGGRSSMVQAGHIHRVFERLHDHTSEWDAEAERAGRRVLGLLPNMGFDSQRPSSGTAPDRTVPPGHAGHCQQVGSRGRYPASGG